MTTYEHSDGNLLGRKGHLITQNRPEGRKAYFYDSASGLVAEVDARLHDYIAGRSLLTDETEPFAFDAGSALVALETGLGEKHLAAARKTEPLTTISLGVEAACNLSCTYCYNDSHYKRPEFNRHSTGMSLQTALSAIEGALRHLTPGNRLTVQSIGGEPLLQFPMIKELVPAAEALGAAQGCEVRFGMNTNGIPLTDDVTAFLIKHRIGVAISIDGSPQQHNAHRRFGNGQGSYDVLRPRIERFIAMFREHSKVLTCRVTANQPTFDFVEAIDHVLGLGFNNVGIGIALSSMLSATDTVRNRDAISHLVDGFDRLRDYCLTRYRQGHLFRISLFNDTMFTLFAYRPKYVPCGAQRRYVGVSPNGDIVPCHRYIGTTNVNRTMGNLRDSVDPLHPTVRGERVTKLPFLTVLDDNRGDNYECRSCWARHICGGECYEVKEISGADFHSLKPHLCDLKRALYRFGMEMLVDLAGTPDLLNSLMQMNASLKPSEVRLNNLMQSANAPSASVRSDLVMIKAATHS